MDRGSRDEGGRQIVHGARVSASNDPSWCPDSQTRLRHAPSYQLYTLGVASSSIFVTLDASAFLKGARPVPVLVRLAFRTALPLPQRVSAFAEALILRLVPEVVGAAVRAPRLLPE